jgi:xylulokinase
MAFDLATARWSAEILDQVGLAEKRLSRAVPSGQVVGRIDSDLADRLGLPRDLALVSGGHDQTCAALGAGVVRPGLGVVSTGTAEVLATALAEPALSRPMFDSFYPCYRHAHPDLFFTFALNHGGGVLLKWFRDQFCAEEVEQARATGVSAYRLLDRRMPAGPTSLLVLPHLNGSGTPSCDLQSKGAIVGLTLATTRHDLAKALLEALCFELAINLDTMRGVGIAVDTLVAVGGGARSRLWLQLKADVLGRPIRTLRCADAACLGAALLAGTALGAYASLEDAAKATVRVDEEFGPNPETRGTYTERWTLYRGLYPALRSLHHSL